MQAVSMYEYSQALAICTMYATTYKWRVCDANTFKMTNIDMMLPFPVDINGHRSMDYIRNPLPMSMFFLFVFIYNFTCNIALNAFHLNFH